MGTEDVLGVAVSAADPILVRDWDNNKFHERVLELESRGYVARRETYTVIAEQHPETGYIVHLYSIELYPAAEITCKCAPADH